MRFIRDARWEARQEFVPDTLDRVTNATGPWGAIAFSYDMEGSRRGRTHTWPGNTFVQTTTYTPNLTYGADLRRSDTVTTDGFSATLEYDGAGRLLSDGVATYTYTPTDMLASASLNGAVTSYAYDSDDLRIRKIVSGSVSYYLHGPSGTLLSEFRVEGGVGKWLRDYVYAGTRLVASVRPALAELRVVKAGMGQGTVTGTGNINCGSSCAATLPMGTSVTLTAQALPDFQFAGWEGACESSGPSVTFPLNTDAACVARFIDPVRLSLSFTGSGTGTVTSSPAGLACPLASCTATFDRGTAVTLRAVESSAAATRSLFTGWSGACAGPEPTNPMTTVVLAGDRSCTASFVRAFALEVLRTGDGGYETLVTGDKISCGGLCANVYRENTTVALTAAPPPWGTFAGWSGAGCTSSSASVAILLDRDRVCSAAVSVTFPKLGPASGATVDAGPLTLTWNAVGKPGAGYQVCWDQLPSGECTRPGGWLDTGQRPSQDVTSLGPGTYRWQARALLGPGQDGSPRVPQADGGTWWTFVVAGTPPPVPVVTKTSPAPEASGLGSTVTLQWTSAVSAPDYSYCWGASATGQDCALPGGWRSTGSNPTDQLSGLAAGSYYWQVRVLTAAGYVYADSGAWYRFTVGASAAPPGTFSKIGPAAGAAGLAQPVVLSWGESSSATSYAYCLDTSVSGSCDGTWQPVASGTSVTVSALTGGATYEWQVKAVNNAGEVVAADGWTTFTVAAAPPPPPPVQKASPASGATVTTTTPTLAWTSSLTNVAYTVCWGTAPGGDSCTMTGGWVPNGQALSKPVLPALTPGTYYWQVRAQTGTDYAYGDGTAQAWWPFTVAGTPPPGAFTLTVPAAGATAQPTSVTLAWAASSGATSYAYCLDPTLGGSCSGPWQNVGTATTATVSGLTGGATYEWQVRAQNGTGTTDATGGWRTFTVAAPAPLTKATPASGTTGLGTPVILTWTSTLTDVAYTVCWDQSNDGQCSGVWWPNGGSKVKWLENLPPGTYYWQVRAQTPTGYVYADGAATYWSFTVGSGPEVEGDGTVTSDPGGPDGPSARRSPAADPPPPAGRGAGLGLLGAWPLRRRRGRGRPARRAWLLALLLLALLWPAAGAAQPTGTTVEYYHLDALGSVRVVTNQAGAVLSRHDYLPFGEEWEGPNPPKQRRLFTGKERDFETGLDYFGARYYRADIGRFTTVDPLMTIEENLVDPQRWNRYAYARNNPLRYTDPTGLYISTCGKSDGDCLDAQRRFEEARQQNLKSDDPFVASAARAYGSLGVDNGVRVNFNLANDSRAGIVGVAGNTVQVWIDPGLMGLGMAQVVAHEGSHVLDAQAFILSGKDERTNPTVRETEVPAFDVGVRVAPYGRSPFGPGERAKIAEFLRQHPRYRGRLSEKVF